MATIKGTRSPLFWRHIPGGLPAVIDTSKFSGNIFYVDSNASQAADSVGKGYHPDYPFDSLDYAVGQCTANQGDVIFVLPGHVETVTAAGGLDLDVAGITIIFLGEGNARGYITFTTAVTADMDVDAADITMINPRFVAGIDALTGPIDVNAARFKIINGTWEDGASINTTDCIVADANADDMVIDGWTFIDGDAGGTQKQSHIQIAGATRPTLKRIRATGDFGTGVIENGTAWVDALLDDCVIENTNAGPVVGILLQATSSGTARNVNVRVASGTTYITADNDMQWFECFGTGTDATAGEKIGTQLAGDIEAKIDVIDGYHDVPTADVATNTTMRDVIGNKTDAAVNAKAANKSAIAYLKGVLDEIAVPAADNVDNGFINDVIGNKTDAAAAGAVTATDTLMAYIKQIVTELAVVDEYHDVPAADNVLNAQINEVIGNKTDAAAAGAVTGTDTLVAYIKQIVTDLLNVDSATTDSVNGKLGTDTELADRSLYDIINGGGPVAAASAAAPANDVSLYGALRAVYNLSVPAAATGETVIDEGDYDWTADYPALLTIAPAAGAPLADVVVHLDMDKAATGFATVYAAQTISIYVERKIDGTNWRRELIVETALAGDSADARDVKISIGDVGITEQVRVTADLSAEVSGAAETTIPYAVYYKGLAAPTITPLTATA